MRRKFTVYGIETASNFSLQLSNTMTVATVLTVYGIETREAAEPEYLATSCNSTYRLRY